MDLFKICFFKSLRNEQKNVKREGAKRCKEHEEKLIAVIFIFKAKNKEEQR